MNSNGCRPESELISEASLERELAKARQRFHADHRRGAGADESQTGLR